MTMTIHKAPTISPNLTLFLHYANWKGRNMRADGRGTLGFADELLRPMDTDELVKAIRGFDGYEPLDLTPHQIGDRSVAQGHYDLTQELFAILDEWGDLYPIDILLNASENGLSTQMPVKEIKPGNGFEIDDHPLGPGKVLPQFQVVEIDESLAVPGKVAYRTTIGQEKGDRGKIKAIDENTMVRPILPDNFFGMNAHGSSFDDPERFVELKANEDEYGQVSDAMHAKVEAAIRAHNPDASVHVYYSAYKSKPNGTPIDNLDEQAAAGPVILVQAGEYDEEGLGDYESPVLESPTWLMVSVHFNDAIVRTGDYHHSFLEGLYLDKKATAARGDGVKVYRFATGS